MGKLIIAVAASLRRTLEAEFDERTAGHWRHSVSVLDLYEDKAQKESNNGDVEHRAETQPNDQILVQNDLISDWLGEFDNVERVTKAVLIKRINGWFRAQQLSWRDNVDEARRCGPYRWADIKQWRDQFHRVDPQRGLRAASAILAQLKIARVADLAEWFDHGQQSADHHAYFLGADPQSGDFGLINTLAARIPGTKLAEAQRLPKLDPGARLRLFTDGGWSGGESVRRLECIYTSCEKKTAVVGPDNPVSMRFAYLTDVAESRLRTRSETLVQSGQARSDVKVSCPDKNRLIVTGEYGQGLAFQNLAYCDYVDPHDRDAFRRLCVTIGEQLDQRRPLGTDGIASTIGFEHSLPRAMLPVLIRGEAEVKAHDGSTFMWQPLLSSKHLSHPAPDQAGYYCTTCPLAPTQKSRRNAG